MAAPKKTSDGKTGCYLPPTGITCPECGQGTLEPARGRFDPVYKCTAKGLCKFFLTARSTGDVCSYPTEDGRPCGHLIVEGTKTIPPRCSDKSCPNRNPHKLSA